MALAGLFLGPVSAAGLRGIFGALTGLTVRTNEFTGAEIDIARPARIGESMGLMLGTSCRLPAAGVEIHIEGSNRPEAQAWAREATRRASLHLLATAYIGAPSPSARLYLWLARISHQAASRRQKSSWFQEVDRDANDRAGCRLRWPCPRGSFGPVRAHAPSTVVPAMLSVASTPTGPKSSAIITAPGEKCGLDGGNVPSAALDNETALGGLAVLGGSNVPVALPLAT